MKLKEEETFFKFLQGFEQGILLPTLQTLKQRVGKRIELKLKILQARDSDSIPFQDDEDHVLREGIREQ